MKKVEIHIVKPCHSWFQEIDNYCLHSLRLFNSVQYVIRQSFFYGHGTLSQAKLDKMFQDSSHYKAMPAKVSQLVIKQATDAWSAYFKALEKWRKDDFSFTGKPKIPGYAARRNLVKFNNQAYGKKELKKRGVLIPSQTSIALPAPKHITRENLCEIRFVPQVGCYVIEVVYEQNLITPPISPYVPSRSPRRAEPTINSDLVAAIDLGVDNLATVVYNRLDVQPIAINGKPLKSANQFFNKQGARFKGFLPPGVSNSKRLQDITRNRNQYVKSYLHQASRWLVNEWVKLGVKVVVIGKNTQWKTKCNIGRIGNQNFIQLPHNTFINILTYKLEEAGIKLIVGEESYTSKASFLDWDNIPTYTPNGSQQPKFSGKRVKRAIYRAFNGMEIHADVNGAYNIGRKVFPTAFSHLKEIVARDRGCLVVHPRRITPLFGRARATSSVA